jgi:hypothetical protein
MCIPVQERLDLAGLQTPEAPLILGGPSIRVTQIISNERRVLVGLGGRGERPATEALGDEFMDPQHIYLSKGFRDKAVNLEAA